MTLLQEVLLYLERTGTSRAAFGRAIGGNTGLVTAWEKGRRHIGPTVAERIRAYMLTNSECKTPSELIDLSAEPDSWPAQARDASQRMIAALRRHHPDICAQARNHSQHI